MKINTHNIAILQEKNYLCRKKIMLSAILYLLGAALGIVAIFEILRMPISTMGKVITIFLLLALSWLGLALYYLFARHNLVRWFR